MWRGRWRALRADRGQSIVELALAAPILVFALIAGIDLLRVAAMQQAIQNSARIGAEVASLTPRAVDNTLVLGSITSELSSTPGLSGVSVTLGTCWGAGSAPAAGPPAAGRAIYQLPCRISSGSGVGRYQGVKSDGSICDNTTSARSGDGGICYARVRVQYTFKTIVPWWFVPNQITVDRSAAMPLFN